MDNKLKIILIVLIIIVAVAAINNKKSKKANTIEEAPENESFIVQEPEDFFEVEDDREFEEMIPEIEEPEGIYIPEIESHKIDEENYYILDDIVERESL
ncbi:MAG: hypothetical protein IJ867_08395 [Clostridia bacterium]|nr:hypothetical protein [Clostridia bacterium]